MLFHGDKENIPHGGGRCQDSRLYLFSLSTPQPRHQYRIITPPDRLHQKPFLGKIPVQARYDIFFGKRSHSLSYSTAAKSSPSRCQYVIDQQGKCEALGEYRNDLTELARRGKLNPVSRREDEIERCVQILSLDQTKNNPIIIGERGKRRTEIVEGLAQGMVHGTLVHRKLISLDTGSLLASAESGRHLVQRLEAVLKDITASSNNHDDQKIIIFIDEIHTLIGADVDVGNLLNSMLGRR
ncbi:hypothetical protein RHGRI_020333 [Rhododendron griersonianum]|uniref:ATPase AAA-type core domain-containing protein n=1 Tax=Rhododendron griersonianum TaxID=479676 RepID=A0AAV6JFU5_9ERIC|nr:hypothetical protein RHGRI_020333 [Rhododendron griersonianum]